MYETVSITESIQAFGALDNRYYVSKSAWSDPEYARDIALSRLGVPFAAGAGMGVTVSSMGKLSYQVRGGISF